MQLWPYCIMHRALLAFTDIRAVAPLFFFSELTVMCVKGGSAEIWHLLQFIEFEATARSAGACHERGDRHGAM